MPILDQESAEASYTINHVGLDQEVIKQNYKRELNKKAKYVYSLVRPV